jgi:hypothetical protein
VKTQISYHITLFDQFKQTSKDTPSGIGRDFKNLRKVCQILFIVAHALAWGIRQLGNRLAITAGHFDHNLKGLIAQIIGQISPNAKSQHAAAIELPE